MRVRKRNGDVEPFEISKIRRAIVLAFDGAGERLPNLSLLFKDIINCLSTAEHDLLDVETIQDCIQNQLMASGFYHVANNYILYRESRRQARGIRLTPDREAMSDYIMAAKYAQHRDGRRELYHEAVGRQIGTHVSKFPKLSGDICEAFVPVYDKLLLPSMRMMQFAGPPVIKHNARGYNCSFTHLNSVRKFGEIFYLLLCGCGVGFSVQRHHISQIPKIGHVGRNVYHYKIRDSIEGWADAFVALIEGAIRGDTVEFDYSSIRAEGSSLSSGGCAPGHIDLRIFLERARRLLLVASGRALRPIEGYDLVCMCAEAVLAGGIRRSSLMCLFTATDTEMLYAKMPGNFAYGGLNSWREMSNNSAVLLRTENDERTFRHLLELSQEYGDPGFFFTNSLEYGTNPCGEIGLEPLSRGFAFCNLCEINVSAIHNADTFYKVCEAAAIIGTLQASYTDFKYLHPDSKKGCERDALLGVSMTGMMDNPDLAFAKHVQRNGATIIRRTNHEWAKRLGINPAKRCTTIKPSGTASLLLGCSSGIHPHHSKRYFRRIIINKNEAVGQYFKSINPQMVEPRNEISDNLVFLVEAENYVRIEGLEFLEKIFGTYENWIVPGGNGGELTHNVSCTVTLSSATKAVFDSVWLNRDRVAAMSFISERFDKKVPNVPLESVVNEIDEARWNSICKGYRWVDWSSYREARGDRRLLEPACAGGLCEL